MAKKIKNVVLIDIPFTEKMLIIYIGIKGLPAFNFNVKLKYPDWDGAPAADGLQLENLLYIEDPTNRQVVLHELSHYLEWLYEELSCQDESEFRACLMADVIMKVEEALHG